MNGGLKATSLPEELKTNIPISLIVFNAVRETLQDDHSELFGLLSLLGAVSSPRVVLSPQHGVGSVKEL